MQNARQGRCNCHQAARSGQVLLTAATVSGRGLGDPELASAANCQKLKLEDHA